MTSQVFHLPAGEGVSAASDCRPPASFPKDYCPKLKRGLARLEAAIRLQYEDVFPPGSERIARALRLAREEAWRTPFPSLFFPALAHLRVKEMKPPA